MLTNSSKRFLALILILTLSLSFGAGHALDETIGSPFNVSAEKLSNGIRLSWSAPSGDVTGYRINRRRPELGEDKLTRIVDNTGNAETSYVDTDVRIEDEVYVYRVTALRGEARGKLSRPLWVEVGPGDFGTAVEPSSTPVPPPSNTPAPPPTNTSVPPTSKSQEQTPSRSRSVGGNQQSEQSSATPTATLVAQLPTPVIQQFVPPAATATPTLRTLRQHGTTATHTPTPHPDRVALEAIYDALDGARLD